MNIRQGSINVFAMIGMLAVAGVVMWVTPFVWGYFVPPKISSVPQVSRAQIYGLIACMMTTKCIIRGKDSLVQDDGVMALEIDRGGMKFKYEVRPKDGSLTVTISAGDGSKVRVKDIGFRGVVGAIAVVLDENHDSTFVLGEAGFTSNYASAQGLYLEAMKYAHDEVVPSSIKQGVAELLPLDGTI